MATVAQFRLPADAFALGLLFERLSNATVEIERVIPTENTVLPYVWISGVDADDAGAALEAVPEIESVEIIDTVGESTLFRCRYSAAHSGGVEAIVTAGVTLLMATGDAEGWTVEVRGDSPAAISAFHTAASEIGVAPSLLALHDLTETDETPALTEPQREALLLADEMGYFDDDRRVTLDDIADDLDISRQALSNRLRRGYRTLIRRYVR